MEDKTKCSQASARSSMSLQWRMRPEDEDTLFHTMDCFTRMALAANWLEDIVQDYVASLQKLPTHPVDRRVHRKRRRKKAREQSDTDVVNIGFIHPSPDIASNDDALRSDDEFSGLVDMHERYMEQAMHADIELTEIPGIPFAAVERRSNDLIEYFPCINQSGAEGKGAEAERSSNIWSGNLCFSHQKIVQEGARD
ncbi:hypothetical protein FISHEDRAFT_58814 [Fistulina hepatica ATCC 64428]|uniref:Uncharacterized protein n=1 Tax=Fistulina hepatica ATCC 64428 TaxID=1128425 RepID=A0A0D7ABZ9_9AGAR|nr:hypothetical protein FISHEDRAFT_58814 [Fistulina hepatica ATCC 64428]